MIRTASLVAALLVLAARPSLSEALIYRWVDDKGVRHYSEGIDTVPEQFRYNRSASTIRPDPGVTLRHRADPSRGASET